MREYEQDPNVFAEWRISIYGIIELTVKVKVQMNGINLVNGSIITTFIVPKFDGWYKFQDYIKFIENWIW